MGGVGVRLVLCVDVTCLRRSVFLILCPALAGLVEVVARHWRFQMGEGLVGR